ncbi:GmrSD restriction endonuclease domain-containing protein [Methyloligella solikamskensis]|uniref:DUF262 domain-containing protein n=1 Tax=Methyloligella solikamskensis TaxID=1177756 RepID=A0ABW3J8E9_9HYPH
MAKRVVLDAMIKRADFAQQSESTSIDLFDKFQITHLDSKSPILKILRKPDFQRETNHWRPGQVVELVSSFAHGELIPSLILWKSDSFVFVIDGAHRLSALRAWVENDYGDGAISHAFYNGEIPEEQKAIAKTTRRMVERSVGRYSDFAAVWEDSSDSNLEKKSLASKIFTKAIPIQWIQGSQEVAETSFFKINSQGTPLDKTEELLLRNRGVSYAIAARSIVRAGTGHKYWSKFDEAIINQIEEDSEELYRLLFEPEITNPIKTLDLPLGGTSSPVDALKMLIDTFAIVDGFEEPDKAISHIENDEDGTLTHKTLSSTKKVIRKITGTTPSSLGLHPAVYFYNEKGRHSRFLFLGTVKMVADAVRNNNSTFFRKFTEVRKNIETILVKRKSVINQALANVNSRQRIHRVSDLLTGMTALCGENKKISDAIILELLGLKGKIAELKLIDGPVGFSDETKSAIALRESLKSAPKCELCGGYLDLAKAISCDHITPKREGGRGDIDNCQVTHPYCNSIKG